MIDQERIVKGVQELIAGLGDGIDGDRMRETSRRVAEFYADFFGNIYRDPRQYIKIFTASNQEEMIIARGISFYSMCEHHLLPFFGEVHIAYIPNINRVTGFSSLVRMVDCLARRPQIQEKLTGEIADVIMEVLKPLGVFVITEAEQLCLTMRNLHQPGLRTISSAIRGAFRREATREEALFLINSNRHP
ncbi:MAG: GTP cyclohydrolase I FolE [candidate division Zixibacteria bacterium CG_4_9_14_3_um_filter_46_8]|nr:MAG: GTP cyclohydrolase I FolE [candidate division Zixibacteria bacterium CG_4_9_14_3_um_filter_46_8]